MKINLVSFIVIYNWKTVSCNFNCIKVTSMSYNEPPVIYIHLNTKSVCGAISLLFQFLFLFYTLDKGVKHSIFFFMCGGGVVMI